MVDALRRVRPLGGALSRPDHEATLTGLGNVALALTRAGREAEALARDEQMLQDCLLVLGPDHELTRYTADKLAEARDRPRPRPG